MVFNACCYSISNTHEHNFTSQAQPLTCLLCLLVLFSLSASFLPVSLPLSPSVSLLVWSPSGRSHFSFSLRPLLPADWPLPPFAPRAPNLGLHFPAGAAASSQYGAEDLAAAALGESGWGGLCARRWWWRRERAATAATARTEAEAEGNCPLVAAERRAKADWSPEDPAAPAASHRLLSGSSGCAATPLSLRLPSYPTTRSLPRLPSSPLPSSPRLARPGRGPPPCLRSWQRHPARGKSSPGISCGLAWFRLLPPRPLRPPALQPHSGPPCLSCDRTDTAGGLEWNKLKVK